MPEPALTIYDATGRTRAVLLMLHGGKERSQQPVTGRSASWRRSLAMQRSIAPRVQDHGVSTWLLSYGVRGWNDPTSPSPLPDARWAVEQAAELDVPIVLLGHSMGARTAARVADDPHVVGLVALAPWFPKGEPMDAMAGKQLVAAQGRSDRITSFRATTEYVDRARGHAAGAELVDMGRVGHYMFRDAGRWNDLAVTRSLSLLGLLAPQPVLTAAGPRP